MSRWLIDTHALLWYVGQPDRLSASARSTMDSGRNLLYCSASCVCELAIKRTLGKLRVPDDILDQFGREGFEMLSVTAEHAWRLAELPLGEHRDPFDRLLVAQALVEELPIISSDEQLDRYGVKRLW